jgi:hypothetical protein
MPGTFAGAVRGCESADGWSSVDFYGRPTFPFVCDTNAVGAWLESVPWDQEASRERLSQAAVGIASAR